MRILDGTRSVDEIELHLTDGEAQQLIEALADCRDDLATVGLSVSHAPVSTGHREVIVFVYVNDEDLDAEVADRMRDDY